MTTHDVNSLWAVAEEQRSHMHEDPDIFKKVGSDFHIRRHIAAACRSVRATFRQSPKTGSVSQEE